MSPSTLQSLQEITEQQGPAEAIEQLISDLRAAADYDRLFDALLLQKRFEMGLSTAQPTSLDVPEPHRKPLEDAYITAAREVGKLFLQKGDFAGAWPYLRTINETDALRAAIDEQPLPRDISDESEQLMDLCLNQGAHPARGLEIMLATHGTCNTITAYDQARQANLLSEADQLRVSRKLVNDVYEDVTRTVKGEVERKMPFTSPTDSLRELIAGREWLFADDNYHVDVSHLNSVVRFARVFNADTPELPRVIELTEYGSGLADQFQYPSEPPYDEFYLAHRHYFLAVAGENVDEHTAYFQQRLDQEPDAEDKPYLAFELVVLLQKIGRLGEAVEIAKAYLSQVNESSGFSFPRLCVEAGRVDVWRETAAAAEDAVSYVAALVQARIENPQVDAAK